MKIEKRNKSLEEFLSELDLQNLEKDMLFSDLEDDEPKVETQEQTSKGQLPFQGNQLEEPSNPNAKLGFEQLKSPSGSNSFHLSRQSKKRQSQDNIQELTLSGQKSSENRLESSPSQGSSGRR